MQLSVTLMESRYLRTCNVRFDGTRKCFSIKVYCSRLLFSLRHKRKSHKSDSRTISRTERAHRFKHHRTPLELQRNLSPEQWCLLSTNKSLYLICSVISLEEIPFNILRPDNRVSTLAFKSLAQRNES